MPLGPWELAIILVIIVIIFGVGKLPEIGGALGKGISEFKSTVTSEDDEKAVGDSAAPRHVSADAPRSETVRTETAREEI